MTTRCKPDDLAIITQDVLGCEDNVGRIVLVRGPAWIDYKGQLTWLITPLGDEPYIVDMPETKGFRVREPGELNIEHPDDWMTPIRHLDVHEEETEEEVAEQ
jgi:hypothetical protein